LLWICLHPISNKLEGICLYLQAETDQKVLASDLVCVLQVNARMHPDQEYTSYLVNRHIPITHVCVQQMLIIYVHVTHFAHTCVKHTLIMASIPHSLGPLIYISIQPSTRSDCMPHTLIMASIPHS
jgi:hypothetical protein